MLGVSEAAEAQGSRESSNPPDLTSRASLTMTERVLTKPKVSKSLCPKPGWAGELFW